MPHIQCNDISLYYETRGHWPASVPPLLCIPGLGNDCTRWERVLPLLAEHVPVLVVDNRGAGRSDAPDGDYSVRQMATDMAALLEQLELDKVFVLGHSMGGFIAQQLAATRPDLIPGAVLASTTPKMSTRDHQLLRHWLEGARQGVDVAWFTRDIFFWMYPPSCFDEPGFMEQVVREALEAPYVQPLPGFAGQVAACVGFDGWDMLPRITARTLVLHGALDQLVPLDLAERMAESIPHATLQVIPEAGHLPQQQMPASFAAQVLSFLAAI